MVNIAIPQSDARRFPRIIDLNFKGQTQYQDQDLLAAKCLTLADRSKGSAETWINCQPELISEGWDDLKEKLIQRFCIHDQTDAMQGALSRMFNLNQGAKSYAEYFELHSSVSQTLLTLWHGRLRSFLDIEHASLGTATSYTLPKQHFTNEPPRNSMRTLSLLPQRIFFTITPFSRSVQIYTGQYRLSPWVFNRATHENSCTKAGHTTCQSTRQPPGSKKYFYDRTEFTDIRLHNHEPTKARPRRSIFRSVHRHEETGQRFSPYVPCGETIYTQAI